MSLKLATEFSASLDNCEFDDTPKFLAEDCQYHYWEGSYQGGKNISMIYRQNDIVTRKMVDELLYSSHVEEIADGSYKINFTDKMRKGHRWHEHRFYEIVTFTDGYITTIEHCDIPGEKESIRMFFSSPSSESVLPDLK